MKPLVNVMLHGMTIWAKHFKIGSMVVSTVPIFVVNNKDFTVFSIIAAFTLFQLITALHMLTRSCKTASNASAPADAHALLAAIDVLPSSDMIRTAVNYFAAYAAGSRDGAFTTHGFVIAGTGTIFRNVCTKRNDSESRFTNAAMFGNAISVEICPQAFPRTATK